ncbi:hypothetical protein [Bradyrhizobium elkanii]|uniref:hypothetical protein n=1 Tax=Bradyrhizobium elkanii TaxID=29448 RepID=UPI003D20351F
MKNIVIGVLVIAALLIGYATGAHGGLFGAASSTGPQHFSQETFKKGFQVGDRGTPISGPVLATTCTAIVYASLGATSTQAFSCPVSGALTTAKVVTFGGKAGSFTGVSSLGNFVIWGGHASSTANYVEGYITNLSGAATSSYSQATSSIPVFVVQ